ncbi:hypothetical protein ACVNP3_11435 [Pseudomonas chlororaphis subsp. piscium]
MMLLEIPSTNAAWGTRQVSGLHPCRWPGAMSSGAADQVWSRAMAKETTIMQATAKLIFMTYLSEGLKVAPFCRHRAQMKNSLS